MNREDISIVTENKKFKFRVSGLLINNGKLLVVKIDENSFYCLPGGHVELLEDTREAIIREFKEETGISVLVTKLLYVTENFFKSNNSNCHEIGFYYLLNTDKTIDTKDFNIIEQDKERTTKLAFKWLDINNLENVKPEFLKKKLQNIDNTFKHLVIKNDEIKIEE